MSGTTYKLIRDRQAEVIQALTPSVLPTLGTFREWNPLEGPTFVDWAEGAGDAFRVFWQVHGLDYNDEKYLDQQTESVVHTQVLLVAYPQLDLYASERMDDVIDSDITDLTKAIGERGYGSYEALGSGLHVCRRIGCQVLSRPSARILQLQFQLDYDRSIP